MHPEISVLPSKVFYKMRLRDGPDMAQKTTQAWHRSALFKPYRFFNVIQGREENAHAGHSLVNREEVAIAMAIYDRLQKDFPTVNFDSRIGIVTMYRAQMLELKRQFQARYTPEILKKIDFNTVDGFQGQEKDIIILSCVRAGPNVQSVGFLADVNPLIHFCFHLLNKVGWLIAGTPCKRSFDAVQIFAIHTWPRSNSPEIQRYVEVDSARRTRTLKSI
jgi:senataxin